MRDQKRPADETQCLHNARRDAKGRGDLQIAVRLFMGDHLVDQYDNRQEQHGCEGQQIPDGDQFRSALVELTEDIGGGLAQNVGVLELDLQQREADSENNRHDDQHPAVRHAPYILPTGSGPISSHFAVV